MTTLVAAAPTPMTTWPTGLARLTTVELRKSLDTRSGRWLLAVTGVVALAVAVIMVLAGKPAEHDFETILSTTSYATAILAPVVGILLVTSEWSQRTALTTFTLVPRRDRVVTAKLFAGVLLGLGVGAVVVAASAVATLAASHPSTGTWDGALPMVAGALGYQAVNVLLGIAFGLLLQSSALAIVGYFVVPTVWTIVGGVVAALQHVQPWLDSTGWIGLISGHIAGREWAHMATSFAFWVVLLGAVGTARVLRRSVT